MRMRLVSNFKDMYDQLAVGDDGGTTYRRIKGAPLEETIDRKISSLGNFSAQSPVMKAAMGASDHWLMRQFGAGPWVFPLSTVMLAFCGRIWLGVYVNETKVILWTPENVVRAFPEATRWLAAQDYAATRERGVSVADMWQRNCQNRQDQSTPLSQDALNLHRVAASPAVLMRRKLNENRNLLVTVHPCLRDIGFASQMTPPQVYQQISSFMDGLLGADLSPAPRPITDELRAEIAGFDKKTSFRNSRNRKAASRTDWE